MFRNRALFGFFLTVAGCSGQMSDQPRLDPLEASPLFADGRGSRPLVEGTVPRGRREIDERLERGRDGKDYVAAIPLSVTRALLERGRERFDIFCSPCHARTGDGDGMVVRRGYRKPP